MLFRPTGQRWRPVPFPPKLMASVSMKKNYNCSFTEVNYDYAVQEKYDIDIRDASGNVCKPKKESLVS